MLCNVGNDECFLQAGNILFHHPGEESSSLVCLYSRPLECAFTPNNQHINI